MIELHGFLQLLLLYAKPDTIKCLLQCGTRQHKHDATAKLRLQQHLLPTTTAATKYAQQCIK